MSPPPLPTPAALPAPSGVPARAIVRLTLIALVLIAGAAILHANDPATSTRYPRCPFHVMTGLYCPGCGTTRGLHHLLHGRVATAFGYNALMVASVPLLAYAVGRTAIRTLRPGARPRPRPPRAAWMWLIVAAVVAFGVLRNLPWRAVKWMAP